MAPDDYQNGGIECFLKDAHVPSKPKDERYSLMFAVLFCLLMTVVEGIFGLLANSLAIMSDAVHMLADVFALSISLFALYASTWPAKAPHTYGWRRAEVVGALCSVFTTWALVVWILFGAAVRVVLVIRCAGDVHREDCEVIDSGIMFGVGIFGLFMNILLAGILHFGGAHGHSHGSLSIGHHHNGDNGDHNHHSHDHDRGHASGQEGEPGQTCSPSQLGRHNSLCRHQTPLSPTSVDIVTTETKEYDNFSSELYVDCDRDTELLYRPCHSSYAHTHEYSERNREHPHGSMNMRAAMLHVLCDCLQSLGVVLAGAAIWVGNSVLLGVPSSAHSYFNLLDPLLSVLFAIVTIITTRQLIKEVWVILLEQAPSAPKYSYLCETLNSVDKVEMVEDLHLWSIGPDFSVLSAHLSLSGSTTLEEAKKIVDEATSRCKNLGVQHTTIQINILPLELPLTV